VNFRWGVSIHVKEQDYDINRAIDKLMDKLEAKITKEKEKVKEVKDKDAVRDEKRSGGIVEED
jgi:putative sigma-54 modulation protein